MSKFGSGVYRQIYKKNVNKWLWILHFCKSLTTQTASQVQKCNTSENYTRYLKKNSIQLLTEFHSMFLKPLATFKRICRSNF